MIDSEILHYILPPIAGIIIGYSTNALAIKMLFWPYQPVFITIGIKKIRVPFTPGLFPNEKQQLAHKIAELVTQKLFTSENVKAITIPLVTKETIEKSLGTIIDAIGKEFSNISTLKKLSRELTALFETFFQNQVPNILITTFHNNPTTHLLLEKALEEFIFSIHIQEEDAHVLSQLILKDFMTAHHIRRWLIQMLTDHNISIINKIIQEKSHGGYFFLTRLITPRHILELIRDQLVSKPEETTRYLDEIIRKIGLEEKMAHSISHFDFKQLSYVTINRIKETSAQLIVQYIVENSQILSKKLPAQKISHQCLRSILTLDDHMLSFNNRQRLKSEIAMFIWTYLDKELEDLLEKAIPALGINALITEKIEQVSPQKLEHIIYATAKKELASIQLLGGTLGFIVGILQILILLIFS